MGDTNKKLIVLIDARESLILSAGRDIVSFGMLIGTALALNTLMPPSGWINAAIAFVWIIWLIGRGERRRLGMTHEQLRAWLDSQAPAPPIINSVEG